MVRTFDELMDVEMLDKMGESGWELCAVIPVRTTATKEQREIYGINDSPSAVTFQYIFKRPVQERSKG